MKERNYSNNDLTVLRRLWEIQKKQFLDPRFLKGKLSKGKFFLNIQTQNCGRSLGQKGLIIF